MHRTYFRTFTTTAAMVLVSFLLIGAAFGFASRQVFVSEARESMMTNSREISRMAVAYAAEGDLRSLELRMTLSTIGASTNQHIFIVNPSGYIITCSDSAVFCEHIGKRLDESVTAILPQSGTVASLGTLGGFYASEHYTVISALTDDGALLGHLFVSKDTVTALSIWETIVPLFFFISLIVLCLALIFSYASSKYFAKPLRDMADAARRFGRGELNVRVEPTDSTDEIGELTEAFNSMADSLEQSETKAARVYRERITRAQNADDDDLRLCRRHSRRDDPAGVGKEISSDHLLGDEAAGPARAQHAGAFAPAGKGPRNAPQEQL